MKNSLLGLCLIAAALTGCATRQVAPQIEAQPSMAQNGVAGENKPETLGTIPQTPELIASNIPVGGNMDKSMDENDKYKLSHALDKPLGQSTTWTNARTNTTYQVTPTRKIVLKDNPYCRSYQLMTTRNDQNKEFKGVACVGSDSNWHEAN